MPILQSVSDRINSILEPDYIRILLIVVTGVLAGYTLMPVPDWLTYYFNQSSLFKVIILFLIAVAASYPLTPERLINSALVSLSVLLLFQAARL